MRVMYVEVIAHTIFFMAAAQHPSPDRCPDEAASGGRGDVEGNGGGAVAGRTGDRHLGAWDAEDAPHALRDEIGDEHVGAED